MFTGPALSMQGFLASCSNASRMRSIINYISMDTSSAQTKQGGPPDTLPTGPPDFDWQATKDLKARKRSLKVEIWKFSPISPLNCLLVVDLVMMIVHAL